ncbi:DUF924 family protein [Janthinobacterium fluminis]|uniref:DUF924 domain-containing protein n=1 Tax=Janthinobacterium fluminis TaxID=2987524 RepID=A0ABT5JYE7_9BURK|nr:DUF924 family protein [Janthinobacterium fluminis]MDC8757743.1 DUF924 domain-containing protein [Janthinobacterium fluminis]
MHADAAAVLDFWFTPPGAARAEWFRKDAQFDAQILARFGAPIAQAVPGGLREWDAAGAPGTLARILLLDQFTRNVYRDTPAAFSGDAPALQAALALVAGGADLTLPPWQRAFVYLPFEHAEDAASQRQAVALFTRLCEAAPGFEGMLDFARRHHDVIARFGRFPHRNGILGRASTAAELAYLGEPGSGF